MAYVLPCTSTVAIPQYTPVKASGANVAPGTANTEQCFGVAIKGSDAAGAIGIQVGDVTKCLVDGNAAAIVAGDELTMGAGRLVKYTGASGSRPVARALEATTSATGIILIDLYGHQPAAA